MEDLLSLTFFLPVDFLFILLLKIHHCVRNLWNVILHFHYFQNNFEILTLKVILFHPVISKAASYMMSLKIWPHQKCYPTWHQYLCYILLIVFFKNNYIAPSEDLHHTICRSASHHPWTCISTSGPASGHTDLHHYNVTFPAS